VTIFGLNRTPPPERDIIVAPDSVKASAYLLNIDLTSVFDEPWDDVENVNIKTHMKL
jgi:hypothetical protein